MQNFKTDGSLPGNDIFIIERMDEGITEFIAHFNRFFIGVIVHALDHAHLRTIAFGGFDLGNRCAVRQADDRFDAVFGSGQRHALSMVSGTARDDAMRFFFVG